MTGISPEDKRLLWCAPLGLVARAGGCAPRRFPQDIIDQAVTAHPGPASRMECASGCSLIMRTDASVLVCDIEVIDTPREFGEFIARSAGKVIGSWRDMAFNPGRYRIEIALRGGGAMRDVEILLPQNLTFVFTAIALDGRIGEAVSPPPSAAWLAVGDSITQGMNAVSPASTYVQRVCDALSIGAWNLGIGGATMDPAPFSWAFDHRPWQTITVALGSNDCILRVPLDVFRAKTREMTDCISARAPRARVILITPPPVTKSDPPFSNLPAYRRAVAAAVAQSGRPYSVVDGLSLIDPARGHLTPDGVHLSEEGFASYAKRLVEAMQAS